MDAIARALLEDPSSIYVILGMAELVILAGWALQRTRGWAKAALAPILLGVCVGLLAMLVVTDREQITRNLTDIASRAEASDVAGIGAHLDGQCTAVLFARGPLDKSATLEWASAMMAAPGVASVNVFDVEVTVTGHKAVSTFDTAVSLRNGWRGRLAWQLDWIERPDGGRIVRVRSLPVDTPGP